jgi:hypothetical protein
VHDNDESREGLMTVPGKKNVDRRNFLKSFGVGSASAAAAAAATGAGLAPATATASESKADRVKKRYRETDHVKAYYRTNRY